MSVEELFDLARIHVLAPANDHVLDAADDVDVAVGVHRGEVTGVHPARRVDRLACRLVVVPVAAHHDVAAAAQLTRYAARDDRARGGIDDLDLDVGVHAPDGGYTAL